jgi:hypothetical protein
VTASLEQRVERLEDARAIERLKARYAAYCDDGYNPGGIASLFVDDGIWEASAFGVHHGSDEIHTFMASISSSITWALHCITNPNVEIEPDGRSASGSWYLMTLCTMTRTDDPSLSDAVVMSGVYTDEFVKVEGEWRFKHLRCHIHQISNLDRGWVRQPFR